MKKITLIAISAIFLLAIVAVGFFGMAFVSYYPTVYATHIEITSDITKVQTNGNITKTVKLSTGENRYVLEWKVKPDNATSKAVTATWDESTIHKFTELHDSDGILTSIIIDFKGYEALTVTLAATGNIKTSIEFYFI